MRTTRRNPWEVSTHSRPKAAGVACYTLDDVAKVSTHSRPKAAGIPAIHTQAVQLRFNSQPPEGGWLIDNPPTDAGAAVSTPSRPKAAGSCL